MLPAGTKELVEAHVGIPARLLATRSTTGRTTEIVLRVVMKVLKTTPVYKKMINKKMHLASPFLACTLFFLKPCLPISLGSQPRRRTGRTRQRRRPPPCPTEKMMEL